MKKLLAFSALVGLGTLATAQPVQTEADAVRLALTNILVQEVKSGRQATFTLKWDYLPESKGIKEQFLNIFTFDGKGKLGWDHEYVLSNEALRKEGGAKAWFKGLKDRQTLALALSGGRLGDSDDLNQVLAAGLQRWEETFFEGFGFEQTGGISVVPWIDYIAAKRDFYAMHYLLNGEMKGAGAVLKFTPSPRGENPMLLSNGLTWRIRVFPVAYTNRKPLYRFAVSVNSKPIKKLFRGSGDTPATEQPRLDTTVGLLKEDKEPISGRTIYRMAKLSLAEDGRQIKAEAAPGASSLQAPTSNLSPSTGSTLIEVFMGTTAKGLLAPLIANNSEAQIFVGGLVGQGKPATVYGLNYIFTENPDGNLGFLYAFVPKADSGFFLGPSLSWGPFIVSVGAQLFNTRNDTLSARLAGTLSIDLSRVFGKSAQPIYLTPKLMREGSEIWSDSEKLYETKVLFILRVQGAGNVTVKQVRDANDATINGPSITVAPGKINELLLPAGGYTISPPEGFEIAAQQMKSPGELNPIPDVDYKDRETLVIKPSKEAKPDAFIYLVRRKGAV